MTAVLSRSCTRVWRCAAASSSTMTTTSSSRSCSSYYSSRRHAMQLPQAVYDHFRHTLHRCGVADAAATAVLPRHACALSTCVAFAPFAVLFTPHFAFHAQQLTALGDSVVDEYLSRALLMYAVRTGAVLTTNAARQLNAVLHNHYVMHLFARQLHFDEYALAATATTTTRTANSTDDTYTAANDNSNNDNDNNDDDDVHGLAFLQPQRRGPSRHDVRGTSFEHHALAAGQSPLGWHFSHFVGAVHNAFGAHSAYAVLHHVYGFGSADNNSNSNDDDDEACRRLPQAACALLLRLVDAYPATNVAEAVLAAQGLSLRFVGKTRMLPDDGDDDNKDKDENNEESDTPHDAAHATTTATAAATQSLPSSPPSSSSSALLLLSGFGETVSHTTDTDDDNSNNNNSDGGNGRRGAPAAPPSIDDVVAALGRPQTAATPSSASRAAVLASLAGGPGLVDYVVKWRERTAALVRRGLLPSPADALDTAGSGDADAAAAGGGGGGWLSERERTAYTRGPAAAHHIDFDGALTHSFADSYGAPHPRDGYRVSRVRFVKAVRDPVFYDTRSDMRNGVPIDTHGEPLHTHLDSLRKRHRRLYEVTMRVRGGGSRCSTEGSSSSSSSSNGDDAEERVVGCALAMRYTVARDAACKAYLGGVLHDLQRLSHQPQGDVV